MRNRKKYVLVSLTVIVLVAAFTGYYLYNKPALDVKHSSGKSISATALYDHFGNDTTLAKKEFMQQVLQVSGEVTHVTTNQQNNMVILLKTGIDGAAVNCTMEEPIPGISAGSKVEIKGICNGMGEGDKALGILGDVYLVRCYQVK